MAEVGFINSIFAAYEATKNTPVVAPANYPVGSCKQAQAVQMGEQIREAVRRMCCEAGFDA